MPVYPSEFTNYAIVGRPSHATFTEVLRENQLQNCPVTSDDANRALKIYGPEPNMPATVDHNM